MKKTKGIKRFLSLLLCAAIILNIVPTVSAGNIDPNSDAPQVSYDTAAEGAVLLENKGTLPLDVENTNVAVFGRTQIDFAKGGGGSGDVNTTVLVNFIDGMAAAGIQYDEVLYGVYQEWCTANPAIGAGSATAAGVSSEAEMPLTPELVNSAVEKADVAIVIIGRNSTESYDRAVTDGDWYLSSGEKAMLESVNAAFDEVVVILNIGSLIDLTWVADYDNITAILNAWQPGSYGTRAVGSILVGEVVPSGKLTDTWAYNYEDYPASKYGTFGTGVADPLYNEDIYVGYRYFETFAPDAVMYEFGYGLSYTTFNQEILDFSANASEITIKVKVTNTGHTYSGKEVVQVYYSAPQGRLGKPAYELAAFAKTDILAPGENQVLTITYNTNDMASYDDGGVTGNKSAYVLEVGEYKISAGNSVKNVTSAGSYKVDSLVVTEQLAEALAPETNLNILTTGSYIAATDTYSTGKKTSPKRTLSVESKYDTDLPWIELEGTTSTKFSFEEVAKGTKTAQEFIAQYTLEELVPLFGGSKDPAIIGKAPGAAGGMGQIFTEHGVVMADGPAGLRLNIAGGETGNTAFPVGTMLGCTWNVELIEKFGISVGEEAVYNYVDIWLAPALNIHRDPLCGRNFEYFSEDPVLSGMMAAATTKGVQSQGIGVVVKHFAVNSQEYNRKGSDSIISERAVREVYLKGFEIAIKAANPWYVMTSYNKINGSLASTNYELNTQILRDEWDFEGSVMTDWTALKDNGNASMLRAQQELSMPTLLTITSNNPPAGFAWLPQPGLSSSTLTDSVVCASCGQNYGSRYGWRMGWVTINPRVPCEDASCEREIPAPPAQIPVENWAEGYVEEEGAIYLGTGNERKYICALDELQYDESGIITGLIIGDVTMGEIQRCAVNLFNSMTQGFYLRTQYGLGKAEYTHGDDWYNVQKSGITVQVNATVKLNKSTLELVKGKSETLIATVEGASTISEWSSSKKGFATVDQNGKVTAVRAGTETITVTLANGASASCTVKVTEPATVKLNKQTLELQTGKTETLVATVTPTGSTETRKWSSDKPNIATVNQNGLVTAVNEGTTKVTVELSNGGSASCTIKVVKATTTVQVAKPTGVKATSAGATSIKVSWKKVNGASGYEVYRANSRNGTYKRVATVSASNSTFTNKSLTSGKTYFYRVRAYNTVNSARKYSSYSSIVNRKATLEKPQITVKAGKNSVTVSWKKVPGARQYEIYRATSSNGKYTRVKTVSANKLSFTNNKLTKGKSYFYRVRAVQRVGNRNITSAYSAKKSTKAK